MPRVKKVIQDEGKRVNSCKIYDGFEFIREYSEEIHGEDFEKLAQQFVEGHPNCIIRYDK